MTVAIAMLAAALAAAPAATNAAPVGVAARARVRARAPGKPRRDMTPVEAFHNFCRPDGKVKFQEDLRPKPYVRRNPDRKRKGPRR